MSVKRLLMTTDAVGGIWQYSLDLCRGLSNSGSEILLACMGPEPSPAQKEQIAAIDGVCFIWGQYPLEWMPGSSKSVDDSSRWLAELAHFFRPDLLHLNGYAHAAPTWQADWQVPVAIAAHSCVLSWWKAVHNDYPGTEWSDYCRRVSEGLAKADMIFAPTRHLAAEMAKIYTFSPAKLRVIPNFSLVDDLSPARKQALIVAAGRAWDEAKNLALLKRISPRLAVPLCIASDLPHTEVLAKMARARVFAHPALYEPFGLAVLEAARCSCALVLADIPSLRELWNGAAVFVDPRNDEAWIRELNRVSNDAALAASLGLQARLKSESYRPAASLDAYRRAYAALLKAKQEAA